MADKKIVCKICGNEFIFSSGEQEIYKERNLKEPVRCKRCRDKKKNECNNKTLTQRDIDSILEYWKANTVKI